MKKLLFVTTLFVVFSCAEANKEDKNQRTIAELQAFEDLNSEEENTKKFIEDYLKDVNSKDWNSKLPKYFRSNPENFLEEHAAFRTSFPNYQARIKHLTVDGNKGIVWLNIGANYAKTYSFESNDNDYGDNIIRGIKAENQALTWDEVWYFDVIDGKFGDEWDFLKDNYRVLKDLNKVPK